MKLRCSSQKLRVVPSLAGGAHMLLPSSGTTVAVRVYDEVRIDRMETDYSKRIQESIHGKLASLVQRKDQDISFVDGYIDNNEKSQDSIEDFDGICSFRDSFKHSIVFFVLQNQDIILNQVGRFESVVNTLQRCLSSGYKENGEKASFTN